MAVKYLKLRVLFAVCANALFGLSVVLGAAVSCPSNLLRNCLTPFPSLVPPPLRFNVLQNHTQDLSFGLRTSAELLTLESEIPPAPVAPEKVMFVIGNLGLKSQLLYFLVSDLGQVTLRFWDLAFSSAQNAVTSLPLRL